MTEPFRKSLGRARQWYSLMHRHIDSQVEAALAEAERNVRAGKADTNNDVPSDVTSAPGNVGDAPPDVTPTPELTCVAQDDSSNASHATQQGVCARFLRNLCPGCFGGKKFGRTFEE
jgi:hypothetical protein